jgi:hypothetical protein
MPKEVLRRDDKRDKWTRKRVPVGGASGPARAVHYSNEEEMKNLRKKSCNRMKSN